MSRGWVGVDLDGTLAHYDGWKGEDHIGEPVPLMLARVLGWLELGIEVRIVTARAGDPPPLGAQAATTHDQVALIEAWCLKHVGRVLPVTNRKDYAMVELWDDRCVAVEPNTGRPLTPSRAGLP
jgi:hypothetical protein